MKKEYEKPTVEIIDIAGEDTIVASIGDEQSEGNV